MTEKVTINGRHLDAAFLVGLCRNIARADDDGLLNLRNEHIHRLGRIFGVGVATKRYAEGGRTRTEITKRRPIDAARREAAHYGKKEA